MAPKKPDTEMSASKVKSLLKNPNYRKALELFEQDFVLDNNIEKVRAQIAEVSVFDPISPSFEKLFNKFERQQGELFVPVRRGWPQPNVVTDPNPEEPAVIQLNKVLVDGKEQSFGGLLTKMFADQYDFDQYDLTDTNRNSPVRLDAAKEKASVATIEDVRKVAIAVLRRKSE